MICIDEGLPGRGKTPGNKDAMPLLLQIMVYALSSQNVRNTVLGLLDALPNFLQSRQMLVIDEFQHSLTALSSEEINNIQYISNLSYLFWRQYDRQNKNYY